MFGIGQSELLILLVVVLLIFGPKNLPRLARSMGTAIRDFRSGLKGVEREMSGEDDEEAPVETSARIEGKGGASVAPAEAQSRAGEKKAHGPS